MEANATESVREAMRALADGFLDGFAAHDAEMGLAVSVVGKDLDRYRVRRRTVGDPGTESVHRDEWRSGRWIETMLTRGHWLLSSGAAAPAPERHSDGP